MAVPRSTWVDDSGSGGDGTVINNAELQKIYDNIDLEVNSPTFSSITTKGIKDNWMAAGGFYFGGEHGVYRRNTAYIAGVGADALAPGTGIWNVDPAWLVGSWRLEVFFRAEQAGTTVHATLVNLTDAPDTAIEAITTTSATGARVRSGVLNLGAGGAAKDFAIKTRTTDGNVGVNLIWARMVRTA